MYIFRKLANTLGAYRKRKSRRVGDPGSLSRWRFQVRYYLHCGGYAVDGSFFSEGVVCLRSLSSMTYSLY
jgi:hypothetical protein